MELLEINAKSGLLRVEKRLVGIVLGGQTLVDILEGQHRVYNCQVNAVWSP